MMKYFTNAIFLIALCFFSGCIFDGWHYQEIKRVKSPDGLVDAILAEGNGGATTGLTYSIFLAPSGTAFDEKSELFAQEQALVKESGNPDIELVWRNAKFLQIRFEKAHIYHFRNNWRSKDIKNFKHIIELRLVPLNEETSLYED